MLDEGSQLKVMSYGNTIENELFWLGTKGWEWHSTILWSSLSAHSIVIFDIGANTGLYSLISAKINPEAVIFAFEPLEKVASRMLTNLSLNNLKVHLNTLALASEDGEGKIFVNDTISDTFDQASLNAVQNSNRSVNAITIKKKKLSTFIREQAITQIDLMKIDVETFEPQVLLGMGTYLREYAPTILIEILNERVAFEVQNLIAGIEYDYYLIDVRKGCKLTTNLIPNKRGNNFLLLNKAKHGELPKVKQILNGHV